MQGQSFIMECIGNCMCIFRMCGDGFGYLGGGGSGGSTSWFLALISMWRFSILYASFRMFGKACVGQLFGHWLWHDGSQKSICAWSKAALIVLVGVS